MDSFEVLTDVKRVESLSEETKHEWFDQDVSHGDSAYIDGEEHTIQSFLFDDELVICVGDPNYSSLESVVIEGEVSLWKVSGHPVDQCEEIDVAAIIFTDPSIEILHE